MKSPFTRHYHIAVRNEFRNISHLTFTCLQYVIEKGADEMKIITLFSTHSFIIEVFLHINSHFQEMGSIGSSPPSSYRKRGPQK